MANQFIIRRTAEEWAADNPVLLSNQLGVESDLVNNVETGTLFAKLGNGVDTWSALPYWTGTFTADGIADLPTGVPEPDDYFPYSDSGVLSKALINNGVKVYRALLTQSSTDAPVATVLENTLGATITWARSDVGLYTGTPSSAILLAAKTCLPSVNASANLDGATGFVETSFYRNGDDDIRLQTASVNTFGGWVAFNLTDGLLTGAFVEILVYP